jgi:hypothetical protein
MADAMGSVFVVVTVSVGEEMVPLEAGGSKYDIVVVTVILGTETVVLEIDGGVMA